MIEKVAREVTGPQPVTVTMVLARLAIIVTPILGTTILAVLAFMWSGLQNTVDRNSETIANISEGFAVQAQILETQSSLTADHEVRIRTLEQWRVFTNNAP